MRIPFCRPFVPAPWRNIGGPAGVYIVIEGVSLARQGGWCIPGPIVDTAQDIRDFSQLTGVNCRARYGMEFRFSLPVTGETTE